MRRPPLTGVVLAGGQSTRFGSDKASALLAGRPLLEWVVAAVGEACDEVLVVHAVGQVLPQLPAALAIAAVEDRYARRGPLAGLISAFPHVRTPLAFAASCDAPLIRPSLPALLAGLAGGADAVVPRVGGALQPLAACYRPASCLPVFEQALLAGRGSVLGALRGLRVVEAGEETVRQADPGLDGFRDANDPGALEAIAGLLAAREGR